MNKYYFARDRFQSQNEKIINFLRERGEEGATNFELSKISLNYTSRLSFLNKQGHVIETLQTDKKGVFKYVLKKLSSEIKYHPKAIEDVLWKIDEYGGKIDTDDFKNILDETGCVVYRKHGYFKQTRI
jgi:predicted transcriptional regulator